MNCFLIKGIQQLNGQVKWSGNCWEWSCWILRILTFLFTPLAPCLGSGLRRHLHFLLPFIVYRSPSCFHFAVQLFSSFLLSPHTIFLITFAIMCVALLSHLHCILFHWCTQNTKCIRLFLGWDWSSPYGNKRENELASLEVDSPLIRTVKEGCQSLWGNRDGMDMARGLGRLKGAGRVHLQASSPAVSKWQISICWFAALIRGFPVPNSPRVSPVTSAPLWSVSLHQRHLRH